jgi:hypothetical protein
MKGATTLLLILTVIAVGSSGCIGGETRLSAEEEAQVRAYADPVVDTLLEGFNQGNYTRYSQDFSEEMRRALNASAFEQNRALVISKIGMYIARGEAYVALKGDYITANYKADFTEEQGVDVRVVFKQGDESHQIYGLWFNSPKLRS